MSTGDFLVSLYDVIYYMEANATATDSFLVCRSYCCNMHTTHNIFCARLHAGVFFKQRVRGRLSHADRLAAEQPPGVIRSLQEVRTCILRILAFLV